MKSLALAILRLYKRWISPSLLPSCRYVPTCSEYAMEAIDRYGALRGGLMAAWRLLRCHPFVKGGYDPVTKNSDAANAHVETGLCPVEAGRSHVTTQAFVPATEDRRLTT